MYIKMHANIIRYNKNVFAIYPAKTLTGIAVITIFLGLPYSGVLPTCIFVLPIGLLHTSRGNYHNLAR